MMTAPTGPSAVSRGTAKKPTTGDSTGRVNLNGNNNHKSNNDNDNNKDHTHQ